MAKRRPKGEGGVYQRHDHLSCPPLIDGHRTDHRCQGRWVATVDLGWSSGKRRRKTIYGRTKKEAQIKLATALRERDTSTLVVASPSMEKWLAYWLDVICLERGLKTNTLKSHRSKVEQYLIPHLGRHRVDRLAPEHIRAMYAEMRRQGLSEATLRQTHAILHRALKVAVREKKAAVNAAELIDAPKTDKNKRTGLSLEDARTVLKIAPVRFHLALWQGMRQAEVLGLRWSDIHLDGRLPYLSVERTLVRKPREGLVFDTPKSDASVRWVPLVKPVEVRLRIAWAEHVASGGTADDLVFHNNGNPIDHRRDWQQWTDLLKTAEVNHVALHAARNTTASLLEAAGVPDRMAAEILGQSSVQVTHGYQSQDLPRKAEAMRQLEAYVGTEQEPETGEQ